MSSGKHAAAVAANAAVYREETTRNFIGGSPHLKYSSMRRLCSQLAAEVFAHARTHAEVPRVLDLGAGEGSITSLLLELGARVTAVDVSESQLDELVRKCRAFRDRLSVRKGEIGEALLGAERYDIVVMSSVLHHIPDYMATIRSAIDVLTPNGQFFSLQDPIRYDSLNAFVHWFSKFGYFSWRVFQGDLLGGLSRRLRRARGIYLDDCPQDNAEYHVTRNGVDQDQIVEYLAGRGFDCKLIVYFSAQAPPFQFFGSAVGISNTFALIARRGDNLSANQVPATEPGS